jgi:uncharacterized phage-associated protein
MYKVQSIASFIIEYENSANRHINYLRLCRYLYFIQAQFLVFKDEPCFEEKILAWDCGPMVECVGREYRMFGNCNIPKPSMPSGYIHHKDCLEIVAMLDYLSKYSNTDLVQIIHKQTPWRLGRTRYDKEITQYSLYSFFKE